MRPHFATSCITTLAVCLFAAGATVQLQAAAGPPANLPKKEKPRVDSPLDRTPKKKLTWQSPEITAMQDDVEKAIATMDGDRRERRVDLLFKRVKQRFARAELHELAASLATGPPKDEKSDMYFETLAMVLVDLFVTDADREGIVLLLSSFSLSSVYTHDIEFFLVFYGTRLKDPVLVLEEAYAKASDPGNRRGIAARVRYAFTALGVQGESDDEFVRNAMNWYRQHKGQLKVNQGYDSNHDSPEWPRSYDKNPLFQWKTAPEIGKPGTAGKDKPK